MGIFDGKAPMLVFLELILGAVTIVWIANFAASIMVPSYDGSQINNIFMIILGPGAIVATLANKSVGATK